MNAHAAYRWSWIALSAGMTLLVAWRCASVPFSHDEAATYFYYIQSGSFLPFSSHVDANNHFLLSACSWLCFKVAGPAKIVLRMPCLASFMLLCYAVYLLG